MTWYELRRSVAWLLRVKDKLLCREITPQSISVDELDRAENEIIECVQKEAFSEEMSQLRSGKQRKRNNCLLKLNPRVFESILRAGGRIEQSKQQFDIQHPIVLPSSHHVTKLIAEDRHRAVGHSGPSITWTSLRQKFWIVREASTVRKILCKCLLYKKRNAKPMEQIMADLPSEHFAVNKPPFYNTGTDYFGPFFVK